MDSVQEVGDLVDAKNHLKAQKKTGLCGPVFLIKEGSLGAYFISKVSMNLVV